MEAVKFQHQASLELPGILADQKVTIKTDAVTSGIYIYIPLLLCLEAMKKAGIKLARLGR